MIEFNINDTSVESQWRAFNSFERTLLLTNLHLQKVY